MSRNRCASCAGPLPKHTRRPKQHCGSDRCHAIFYGNQKRGRCARCRSKLPRGRSFQRAAICGRCFVDLCDLAGLPSVRPLSTLGVTP